MSQYTLQDRIDRDLALNLSELMLATGYGRAAIKRMNLPLVFGKLRLSDFWKYWQTLQPITLKPTTTGASPVPRSSDLQSIVDKMRAPRGGCRAFKK
jgi:hypothetical protein